MAHEEMKKLTLGELLTHDDRIVRMMAEALYLELVNYFKEKEEKSDGE